MQNYGQVLFLKKSSALPTSCLFESVERTKPAFLASVDSAVPLSLDFSCSLFGSKAFLFWFCKGSVSITSSAPQKSWCGTCEGGAELCVVPTLDLQVLLNVHDVGSDRQHNRHKQSACRKELFGLVQRIKQLTKRERNTSPHRTACNTLPIPYSLVLRLAIMFSQRTFFHHLINRKLKVISLYDPIRLLEQNQYNVYFDFLQLMLK